MSDETILQEAQRLVYGDRQADYGHPHDDYARTARMWEAILGLPPGHIAPSIACLMMAAVNMKIEPASAPPPDQMARAKPSLLEGSAIGVVPAPGTLVEETQSTAGGKTSLAQELLSGNSDDVPVIRSISTASAGGDIFWWPQQVIFDPGKAVRRDGAAQQFTDSPLTDLLPGLSQAHAAPVMEAPRLALAGTADGPGQPITASEGKGDMPLLNREGKSSLMSIPQPRKTVAKQD